jgi:DNA-binding transcriptional LysR family regulator
MIPLMINQKTNFELLQVLIAAAESKNFYEAARKLGLSQPAVSKKLRQLEDASPQPVFVLRGKRKVLARYGAELYGLAKRKIEDADKDIEEINRKYLEPHKLTLRVACRNEVFDALAPKLLFPGKLVLHSFSGHAAILSLLNREVDLAISHERPDSKEIISKRVLTSQARLLVHSKWLRGKSLDGHLIRDPNFLKSTPTILYQEDGHVLEDWLNSLQIPISALNVAAVTQDWRSIQTFIDKGYGYGVVPNYIPSSSRAVKSIELPAQVLKPLPFYVSFHREIRRVGAFSELLDRLSSD